MSVPPTHIEVEGDKPKVERTRKHFAKKKPTEDERRDAELLERFGSAIQLSVKVLRPAATYPYEREVWTSEIRVPVEEGNEHVQAVVNAWVKTMEAGIDLARSFGLSRDANSQAGPE